MAGIDAGEWVDCPSCGTKVLGKSMIPVLGDGDGGVRYLCVACARALIVGPAGTTARAAAPTPGADTGPAADADQPDGLVAASGAPLAADRVPDGA